MTESKILPSCIPLPLENDELIEIVEKAKDYALAHGVCMRPKANYNPDSLHVSCRNSRSQSDLEKSYHTFYLYDSTLIFFLVCTIRSNTLALSKS